jgi:hypothetical protein
MKTKFLYNLGLNLFFVIFIFWNNSDFILYSFIPFIIFAFWLGLTKNKKKEKQIWEKCFLFSLMCIIISSIIFFLPYGVITYTEYTRNTLSNTNITNTIIKQFSLSEINLNDGSINLGYSNNGLIHYVAYPLAHSKPINDLIINWCIFGYYLLISAILGIFIKMVRIAWIEG